MDKNITTLVPIIHKNNKEKTFTEKERKEIATWVTKQVLEEIKKGQTPRINGSTTLNGCLTLRCQDSYSAEWLRKTMPNKKNDKGESYLETSTIEETTKQIKGVIWVPAEELKTEEMIAILQAMNQQLRVDEWRAIYSVPVPTGGTNIHVLLNEEQRRQISHLQGKLQFTLGPAFVRLETQHNPSPTTNTSTTKQ